MSIRFIRSSWDAKYVFDLDPVSVERIDILESKLRDYRDELEKLRGPPSFANLVATTKTTYTVVLWNVVEADGFLRAEDGVLTIVRPGFYHVASIINCVPSGHNQIVGLLKNGKVVQQVYCAYAGGRCTSAALDAIVRVEMENELTVNCPCDLSGTSYLSVTLLRN
ncbi:hypothetical protein V7S43_013750 [Phytophthora oleae]|uniref:C1q domain-containing protein n=1 Tax=Phytophthora oleae TaxID=2107226 RepID=A0ABD3F2Y0_9STRA